MAETYLVHLCMTSRCFFAGDAQNCDHESSWSKSELYASIACHISAALTESMNALRFDIFVVTMHSKASMGPPLDTTADAQNVCIAAEPENGVTCQQYADEDAFKSVALPILQQDVLRNTLCLTQLQTNNRTLAVLSCHGCRQDTVLVAGVNKGLGYSTCYASAGACCHIASHLLGMLNQQLQDCEKVTMTAATAALILSDSQINLPTWSVDHQLQLMVFGPHASSTLTVSATAPPHTDTATTLTAAATASMHPPKVSQSLDAAAGGSSGPLGATAAGATVPQPCSQPMEQQQLTLRKCSADVNAALVVSWSAAFLQEVFHMAESPHEQVIVIPLIWGCAGNPGLDLGMCLQPWA